jgi:hypothetical protein
VNASGSVKYDAVLGMVNPKVPEPATVGVIGVLALMLTSRRNRRAA